MGCSVTSTVGVLESVLFFSRLSPPPPPRSLAPPILSTNPYGSSFFRLRARFTHFFRPSAWRASGFQSEVCAESPASNLMRTGAICELFYVQSSTGSLPSTIHCHGAPGHLPGFLRSVHAHSYT